MAFTTLTQRLTLLFFFITFTSYSEKLPFKFGKVSVEELTMAECSFYPSANSMTLGEYGMIDFTYSTDEGWQYYLEVGVRKKIFKITDADQGNVKIRLYQPVNSGAREQLLSIKAYSHNLVDGKEEKTKLPNNEYFERRLNDYWIEISFAIPNVQEGSVIEYTYRKSSDYLYNLTTWYFQSDIPVAHSQISYTIPEYFNYQVNQLGYVIAAEDDSEFKQETFTYKWQRQGKFGQVEKGTNDLASNSRYRKLIIRNIPPVEDEPYMNNRSDAITRLQFQLVSTKMPGNPLKMVAGSYDKFNAELASRSNFGKRLENGGFIKDMSSQLSEKTDMEKAQVLYGHIANHFSWNQFNSFLSSDAGKPAYNKAEGDAADINLTLIAAYREIGIEAYPVVLSTRGHGTVHPRYPSYEEYDYVIAAVKVDNQFYLCDATTRLPFGQLPVRCRNGSGWLVDESIGQWIDLKSNSDYKEVVMLKTQISPEHYTAHVTHKRIGYSALNTIQEIQESDISTYAQTITSEFNNYGLKNFQTSDIVVGDPITIEFDLTRELDTEDVIYVQPITFGTITSNPFQREERKSAIDLPYKLSFKVISQIEIPEGYRVEMPESFQVSLPDNGGMFIYNCTRVGNNINVISQVDIKQTTFPAEQYGILKNFYQIVADKNNEMLVLSK